MGKDSSWENEERRKRKGERHHEVLFACLAPLMMSQTECWLCHSLDPTDL